MEKAKRNEKKNRDKERNAKKNDLNIFWLDARMYSDLMRKCQESRDKFILK